VFSHPLRADFIVGASRTPSVMETLRRLRPIGKAR